MQLSNASEIEHLLDKRKDLIIDIGNRHLIELASKGSTNLYQTAISFDQSVRSRTGTFFEMLWSGFLQSNGFDVVEQPKSLTNKRADLALNDRIIIDATASNRERMKNKILYQKCYPNHELHIITGDSKPPSEADLSTLFDSGVHLIVRDSVYQLLDNHPCLHGYSSYVNEIRI